MNARLPLLAAAALSILSLAPASAATIELFHETFDANLLDWNHRKSDACNYDHTWTEANTVKPGYKGIRLGSTSEGGSITSEEFSLHDPSVDVTITIVAAAYSHTGTSKEGIAVTAYDSLDNLIFSDSVSALTKHTSTADVEIPATTDYTHIFTIPVSSLPSSGGIYLTIESIYTNNGQRRALIGDVLVTQFVDSGLPPLVAPDLTPSNVGYFGFTFSWTGISGATGYDVVVKDANGAPVNTVTVNGTTATVTDLEEDATYKVSVVAKGDGTTTDDSDPATLTVTTATAPAVVAPVLTASDVSSSSLTVSWPEQTSAASYSVCAWHFDFVDEFTEMFPDWFNNIKTLPSGWTRSGTALGRYAMEASPIQFDASNQTLTSPVFPGSLTRLSFRLRQYSGNENNASTFAVYGSSGEDGAEWNLLRAIDLYSEVSSDSSGTDFSLSVPTDVHQFRFAYTKGAGNCGFGTFAVSGTDVYEVPFYLQGYGPTATSTTLTSVTLTPVAGEKNYVEVTAVGQTGKTATATLEVDVPSAAESASVVISVR